MQQLTLPCGAGTLGATRCPDTPWRERWQCRWWRHSLLCLPLFTNTLFRLLLLLLLHTDPDPTVNTRPAAAPAPGAAGCVQSDVVGAGEGDLQLVQLELRDSAGASNTAGSAPSCSYFVFPRIPAVRAACKWCDCKSMLFVHHCHPHISDTAIFLAAVAAGSCCAIHLLLLLWCRRRFMQEAC